MEHERKFVKVTASRRSEARRSEAIQECHEVRRGEARFQKVGRGEARRGRGWSRRGEAIPRNLASFRALLRSIWPRNGSDTSIDRASPTIGPFQFGSRPTKCNRLSYQDALPCGNIRSISITYQCIDSPRSFDSSSEMNGMRIHVAVAHAAKIKTAIESSIASHSTSACVRVVSQVRIVHRSIRDVPVITVLQMLSACLVSVGWSMARNGRTACVHSDTSVNDANCTRISVRKIRIGTVEHVFNDQNRMSTFANVPMRTRDRHVMSRSHSCICISSII